MEQHPTLAKTIRGFQREDTWADLIIKEDLLASGVATTEEANKSRKKLIDIKNADIVTLVKHYNLMPLKTFMDNMAGIR